MSIALVTLGVLTALVGLVLLVLWLRLDSPRPQALPPPRPPTPAEKLVARLINAMDHDMRSLELGRWFLDQVRRQARERGGCEVVDVPGIVARVPGANEVTRAELRKHLTELVALLCSGGQFDAQLDALARALLPDGLLGGMPGYRLTSARALP